MADTCCITSGLSEAAKMDSMDKQMNKMDIDVGKVPKGVPEKYSDPSTIVPPSTLSELIATLHDVFSAEEVCVEYVQKLMTSYQSNPQDWKKFAKFDKYKYTRNLVDEGNGKFNLLVLCWNEGQGSGIHSHADSHCFLKVLSGSLKEELYYWPEATSTAPSGGEDGSSVDAENRGPMKKKDEMSFGKNQCTYINDGIGLHRVENDSHVEKAVTLHLYSPPFEECQCFDQRSGRISTSRMTFWTKYGKRTPYGKNPEKCAPCNVMEDN